MKYKTHSNAVKKELSMSEHKGCHGCRHHHKSERRKALQVADEDMELVEFDDDPQVWYVCRHPLQLNKEIGAEGSEPAPGAACELFEEPEQRGLSPELERLLAQRESR